MHAGYVYTAPQQNIIWYHTLCSWTEQEETIEESDRRAAFYSTQHYGTLQTLCDTCYAALLHIAILVIVIKNNEHFFINQLHRGRILLILLILV